MNVGINWRRLGRFLLTTSKRDGVRRIFVAFIIFRKNRIFLVKSNDEFRLPSIEVGEEELDKSLWLLLEQYGLEKAEIRKYIGKSDGMDATGNIIRQFNFEIEGEIGNPAKGKWVEKEIVIKRMQLKNYQ